MRSVGGCIVFWGRGGVVSSPVGLEGAAVSAHVENAVALGDAFEVRLLTSAGGSSASGVGLVGGGFVFGGSGGGPVSGGFRHLSNLGRVCCFRYI